MHGIYDYKFKHMRIAAATRRLQKPYTDADVLSMRRGFTMSYPIVIPITPAKCREVDGLLCIYIAPCEK